MQRRVKIQRFAIERHAHTAPPHRYLHQLQAHLGKVPIGFEATKQSTDRKPQE